jgi:hypothetical protein
LHSQPPSDCIRPIGPATNVISAAGFVDKTKQSENSRKNLFFISQALPLAFKLEQTFIPCKFVGEKR